MSSIGNPASEAEVDNKRYTVVARRYRPRDFTELVGQQTVVQALTTAIQSNRVGHAYLFTGARGVGKTSTARIFAKALNASESFDGSFDPDSEIAHAIESGEDIDVIEIDGASNRGIDEIRQLRANVAIRPSRSRYKIYIIDEVHMLTTQAFNALLKTLEEPPEHVKFIFCTTDPEKVPITVLSRCQRFDFAPVQLSEISQRLKFICDNEKIEVEPKALEQIARRAAGSMRDSQSLLEQLISFSSESITLESVHRLLGTADDSRLAEIAKAMIERNPGELLSLINQAILAGIDAGQLGEQLLGYLRDMMAIGVGASPDILRTTSPESVGFLKASAEQWGISTLLAAIQVLDEALVKMKHSTQGLVLLEVAAIQICQLQDLQALSDLLAALKSGKSPPPVATSKAAGSGGANLVSLKNEPPAATPRDKAEKKKDELTQGPPTNGSTPGATDVPVASIESELVDEADRTSNSSNANSPAEIELPTNQDASTNTQTANALPIDPPSNQDRLDLWLAWTRDLPGMIADCASMVVRIDVDSKQGWIVRFPQGGAFAHEFCSQPDSREWIDRAVREGSKGAVSSVTLNLSNLPSRKSNAIESGPKTPLKSQPQLFREYAEHPKVKSILECIDGEIVKVDLRATSPPA